MSDISQCNSFISLFLSRSTCCHLRKLRRDYCSWPTQTWDHWSLRWTNYTAGCRHFCFCCGSTLIRCLSCFPSLSFFHPLFPSFSNITRWRKYRPSRGAWFMPTLMYKEQQRPKSGYFYDKRCTQQERQHGPSSSCSMLTDMKAVKKTIETLF